MAKVTNIESRVVQTTSAWEAVIGEGAAPNAERRSLDLNSYSDGGAKYEATTRSVMNGKRGAQKGSQTSRSANFGYNIDNTLDNVAPQVAAFMFSAPYEQATTRSIINGAVGVEAATMAQMATGTTVQVEPKAAAKFSAQDIVKLEDGTNDTSAQIVSAVDATTGVITVVPVQGGKALVAPLSVTAHASLRRVGIVLSGTSTVYMTADSQRVILEASSAAFAMANLNIGQWIFVGNDAKTQGTGNNQPFFGRIIGVSPNSLQLDTTTLAISSNKDQLDSREVYFPTMIVDGDTKMSSEHSRYLGVNSDGKHMRENTRGCIPNELTFNAKERSFVSLDLTYMATDVDYLELTDSENAQYGSNVISPPATDVLNTSTDIVRQRMTVPKVGQSNTASIHSFVTESTIQIKNNLTELTANGSLGNIGASAGEFSVTGTVNTYFTSLAAMNAVRCNCTVALDWTFARKHQGLVIDIPALTLGAESVTVEKNNSIRINLTQSAFESNDFGYTMSYNMFHYLPASASPTDACDC